MIQTETLELLEWSRLCQHLSTFAATKLGAIAARNHTIPETQHDSTHLLTQTQEAYYLEINLPNGLPFGGLRDIWQPLEYAEKGRVLMGKDLLDVATTLAGARQLRRTIDAQDDVPVLQALVSDMRTHPDLEQDIHRCIDDNGRVSDRANPKLAGIREKIRSLRDRIYDTLQKLMQRQSGAIQESVITQRGDRFVLAVKAPQKDAVPGIVHDASTSGATLYIEPDSIVYLGNQFRQALRQEQTEEEKVCRVLTEHIAQIVPDIEKVLLIVTTLDLATARARYAIWLDAYPPTFIDRSTDERVVLRKLRHPLLVWQQHHEEGPTVVPIDLSIQPQIRVVAITGPNTGGKTVTLKTLGLACVMAKAGMFVPASEPVQLPWFQHILADIGDEQSLQQSLSTFSGHIRRISRVLAAIAPLDVASNGAERERAEGKGIEREEGSEVSNQAAASEGVEREDIANGEDNREQVAEEEATTYDDAESETISNAQGINVSPSLSAPSNSLILLDEVGAGTDPSEGSALAIALLQHLAKHAQLTIATTHFGELKALKYQDERFENASVEFDDVSLSPTYRLLWGIPGRSNALAIAARLGLDSTVIDQAKEYVGFSASSDVNEVIAGLEDQRRQQEAKAAETAALLKQAERLHAEVARKAFQLKERERELKHEQEQQIQTAIAEAKSEIASVIRQLQKGNPTAQQAQKATDSIQQLANQHLPSQQKPAKPKPGYRPQLGERVRIPRLGQTAEVLTLPDDDGELTVRFGLMKMTVSLSDVESLQGEKAELPQKPKPEPDAKPASRAAEQSNTQAVRTSKNTIDLRGSRVADAEIELDRAIAAALTSPIWIIHGHGTGKLKRGVQTFLKQHPQVETFEFADKADGGTGVTVAHLK
ncbi:MAG: endonuclease MutS2 [Cyanobacteria bacterium J06627_8]